MLIKDAQMLVTDTKIGELQDRTEYCRVGLLALDDGTKFDVTVREKDIYSKLMPMTKVKLNLDLTNSKFGMKLSIKDVVEVGKPI